MKDNIKLALPNPLLGLFIYQEEAITQRGQAVHTLPFIISFQVLNQKYKVLEAFLPKTISSVLNPLFLSSLPGQVDWEV